MAGDDGPVAIFCIAAAIIKCDIRLGRAAIEPKLGGARTAAANMQQSGGRGRPDTEITATGNPGALRTIGRKSQRIARRLPHSGTRKSVVKGRSVEVRVDHGGRSSIK